MTINRYYRIIKTFNDISFSKCISNAYNFPWVNKTVKIHVTPMQLQIPSHYYIYHMALWFDHRYTLNYNVNVHICTWAGMSYIIQFLIKYVLSNPWLGYNTTSLHQSGGQMKKVERVRAQIRAETSGFLALLFCTPYLFQCIYFRTILRTLEAFGSGANQMLDPLQPFFRLTSDHASQLM